MIKDLIFDISHDKINLSQALTRSKIIAARINNEDFKKWLRKELEGYDFLDELLPSYRTISCQTFITSRSYEGQEYSSPVVISTDTDSEDFSQMINFHRVAETISALEKQVLNVDGNMHVRLPYGFVIAVAEMCDEPSGKMVGGYKQFHKGQILNIVDLTKQKLLDTLLELYSEFPDLENEFNKTEENMEKANNIITNHIYGNQNPVNIAAGVKVEQKDIHTTFQVADLSELKKYGVAEKEIEELKTIVEDNKNDKSSLTEKATKWIGNTCATLATKELAQHIPAVIEFVHKHVL